MTKKSVSNNDEVAQLQESLRRVLADYANLERRMQAERQSVKAQACRSLILDLLPTLDNLGRMTDHNPDPALGMITVELQKTLGQHGLERLWSRNKPFDPLTMEAVGTAPGEKDVAVREELAGYELNGEVLRHAKVLVGTGQTETKEKKE